ncbi:MAG: hypothetical protein Fur0032_10650 [Terrimicrobiaceae bacterium]
MLSKPRIAHNLSSTSLLAGVTGKIFLELHPKSTQPSGFNNPVNLVKKAFSLVEVVLALGVISFAIVAIMGMLPVALRTGLDSQRETRATNIARMIFSDLSASSPTNLIILKGTNRDDQNDYVNPRPSLATWSSPIEVYFNEAGQPVGQTISADATMGATIRATPNTPISGLARVQVDVFAPPQAAATNRTTFTFVTLMRQ